MTKRRPWTERDRERLVEYLNQGMNHVEIAGRLHRSTNSIRQYCCRHKISSPLATKPWTEEEVRILRKMAPNHTLEEVTERIGRTRNAVYLHALGLGLKFAPAENPRAWSEEDLQRLRDLLETHTKEEIAEEMGISIDRVAGKIAYEGLTPKWRNVFGKKCRFRYWTDAEVFELLKLAENYRVDQIAEKLNRSRSSVLQKMDRMGLRLRGRKTTVRTLANELGVSVNLIQRRRDDLGLKFRKVNPKTGKLNSRGATPREVVKICDDILENPKCLRIPARRVREVRARYEELIED